MFKNLKKNQVIIYVIALMLVAAGYLNYTSENKSIETYSDPEVTYKENIAEIGDATLVNSNETIEDESKNLKMTENSTIEESKTDSTKNLVAEENSIQSSTSNLSNVEEYFSKSRLDRDTMYSQMIETYQNIINSSTVSEEQKSIATQEITNINNTKNAIMICENLLGTKGFEKNVVFSNGGVVSVVVKTEGGLATNQVAQIQNIISREMGVEIQNINITEK